MTHDDIIKLAKQAGYETDMFGIGIWDSAEFNRFAQLVAQHERECCAKVCESMDEPNLQLRYEYRRGALNCADAIRARSKT
jgi:hypothetical protein